MFSIGVEIEHKKYARLIHSDGPASGTLDLTTLADFQKRAIIRLFLFRKNRPKVLLKEIVLDRLPQKPAGDIRIILSGELRGKKNLVITIRHGGQTVHTSTVPLKESLRRGALWLIIPIAVIAAGLILFFSLCSPQKYQAAPSEEPPEERFDAVAEVQPEIGRGDGDDTEYETEDDAGAASDGTEQPAVPEQAADSGQTDETAVPRTDTVTVYFEPNSARLVEDARETLDALVSLLEEYREISVSIDGHCALRGSEQGRIELSEDRSREVRRYLLQQGWNPEAEADVEGHGGLQPVTEAEADQYLNRRVEIAVTYLP